MPTGWVWCTAEKKGPDSIVVQYEPALRPGTQFKSAQIDKKRVEANVTAHSRNTLGMHLPVY